ncbi:hypothetical protein QE152_g29976 [Popillia japonica]|uniref:Uncharacterized protein n=1 Tax=Popillia japonica TaxID=7064 RepID=A0AAW1JG53_POPJA
MEKRKHLQDIGKEETNQGQSVKIGYNKLTVDGREFRRNKKKRKIEDPSEAKKLDEAERERSKEIDQSMRDKNKNIKFISIPNKVRHTFSHKFTNKIGYGVNNSGEGKENRGYDSTNKGGSGILGYICDKRWYRSTGSIYASKHGDRYAMFTITLLINIFFTN